MEEWNFDRTVDNVSSRPLLLTITQISASPMVLKKAPTKERQRDCDADEKLCVSVSETAISLAKARPAAEYTS